MRISKIDKNFTVRSADETGMVFFDVTQAPFSVHGLLRDEAGYFRMPQAVADAVSEGVAGLNLHTAGGRVRFATDARHVALRAQMRAVSLMPHFAFTGSAGFDLYADNVYRGTFVPPMDVHTGYSSEIWFEGEQTLREITVHFPLYSGVVKLELGLPAGSELGPAAPYGTALPVAYYGSSITQGGCASRPGNAYQNVLSRRLDCDHINLGFSGNAKGEPAMADYIAGLPMSAFVLDYDHNAPTTDHLVATHAPFYKKIREAQPALPILMLSRPQPNPTKDELARRDVVRQTWQTARATGDEHVFFLDGTELLTRFGGDGGTVDNCHPNDLGFACMAAALEPVLREALAR